MPAGEIISARDVFESDIRCAINESLGISDKVSIEVNRLKTLLINNIRSNTNDAVKKDGVSMIIGMVNDSVFNKKISISYTYYNFNDKEIYNNIKSELTGASSIYFKNHLMMSIPVISVCGNIDKPLLADTMQHELEHLFEECMCGSVLPKDERYRDKTKYVGVIDNEDYASLSRLCYYNYKFEQDAFANGLYAELMTKEICPFSMNDIRNTSCYEHLVKYRNALDYVRENKESDTLLNIAGNIGISNIQTFIVQSENIYKAFSRKIGRVIIKAHDDFLEANQGGQTLSLSENRSLRYIFV